MSETPEKTAVDLLNAPKAFQMVLRGLQHAQERLEFVAGIEGTVARLKQEEALALTRKADYEREGEAILTRAKDQGEKIVGAAQREEGEIRGRIAGARQELADLEGKVAEAVAQIRQGTEWAQKMSEADAIARRGRA